ncbi:hypothetical protein AAHU66_03690 [Klebsiella pneumoniae]|uniref:Lipoprotein n=3 Tax=Enterobacteriaceae TaxID=543 RepID=A0ABZ2E0M6_RAOOR|nr:MULTISPECIES: hypothetical protein [Enterobacteriaceae]HAT2206896.1 hypothetical protein [Kluyvera intermedia]HAT2278797.1 hypothetical protein [Raoultella ornithinolytica]AKL15186.1 hypothetical protein AB182_29665 [Phytobacter ursingii]EJK5914848.1 hypothetical protein [Escherichia coli]ELO7118823.1 hypothetical protein [Escherichia coli]
MMGINVVFKVKKITGLILFSSFILSGCQQLQSSYNSLSDGLNKLSIPNITDLKKNELDEKSFTKTSLKVICSDFHKNPYMANDKWNGKYVEFTDKIINVSQSGPRFTGDPDFKGTEAVFIFDSGIISSGYKRECKAGAFVKYDDIKKYNVGDVVTVKGVLLVDNDYSASNKISLSPAKVVNK